MDDVAGFWGVTAAGPVLGPDGRELVAVEFGEVVGCHQLSPIGAHCGVASSVESGETGRRSSPAGSLAAAGVRPDQHSGRSALS